MQFPFFHNQKPRRFYHRPIYWNPEEENSNAAVKEAKQKAEQEGGDYIPALKRGSFRRAKFDNQDVDRSDSVQKERRAANIRWLIIALMLFALAFYLYYSSADYINL